MALGHSDSSLFIGSPHIRLKRINSTNAYALEFISKSNPIEGTVISASFQYAGKGQIGRFWESEDGKNITCSTILRPTFIRAHDQFYLNMAISLALADLIDHILKEVDLKASIKWPNDIYVGDEKIAGILIQNSIVGKNLNASVIGTGININQIQFSGNIPNPTSIATLLTREIDLESAFNSLFDFLSLRYTELKTRYAGNLMQGMKQAYLDRMYRLNTWADFKTEDEELFSGRIIGIDEIGRLQIQRENDSIKTFSFREIQFIL